MSLPLMNWQIPLPGVTVPLIKTENVEALRSCCRAVMLS